MDKIDPAQDEEVKVKDLNPDLDPLNIVLKVIVVEKLNSSNSHERESSMHSILVADDSASINHILRSQISHALMPGDILRVTHPKCILHKNKCMSLYGGKVEKIGEFTMLLKESHNMSRIHWTDDPEKPGSHIQHIKGEIGE